MLSFKKVLIANRGEIACRIIRTLRDLNIESICIYSEADVDSDHVSLCDKAFLIGPADVKSSYLQSEKIIQLALDNNVDAIHPGYGLLSENTDFASACEKAGIEFLGPTADQITSFSLKHTARELAEKSSVPILPGSPLLESSEEASKWSKTTGFPLMIKSSAGGGGIGMSLCYNENDLPGLISEVAHLSEVNFKNSGVYIERFVETARHIEVQIFGDGKGHVLPLGLRDCSMQRRHQKVIEETPAPGLTPEIEEAMIQAAVRITSAANYRSAGTVEFLYDVQREEFYFLEVNTRLQVEHGVTEEIFNIDIVEWMVRLQGDSSFQVPTTPPESYGHSIQVRVYAEDPSRDFQPSTGTLSVVKHSPHARCDSWVFSGTEVCAHYDPLLSKIIVKGEDRPNAISKLQKALEESHFEGIETNLEYLKQLLSTSEFNNVTMSTGFLKSFEFLPNTIEIRSAGTMTTVQDYPGRTGYWDVGIPPSGPMDNLSFRIANFILGNEPEAAGLEFTHDGATLIFHQPSVIALSGAEMKTTLNGNPVNYLEAIEVSTGDILKVGRLTGFGARSYMAVKHGIQLTPYLGSRSTFTLGKFGGHAGRALRAGDMIHIIPSKISDSSNEIRPFNSPPRMSNHWNLSVIYGPHGAPDFFQPEDISEFIQSDWEVHYNSARTGIRLIGPKPKWAREDGGEAGLHPSNIHDNAYAIGAVDFTGDMPVILGVDGPSLGGFVCPFTVISADLWKLGQLKPGDKIRFRPVSADQAIDCLKTLNESLIPADQEPHSHTDNSSAPLPYSKLSSPIIYSLENSKLNETIIIRQSGDSNLLLEFGELELDIKYRLQVQLVYEKIKDSNLAGVTNLTPGIRSLQIQYNPNQVTPDELIRAVANLSADIRLDSSLEIPSRIVHLPLSWDDPTTQKAIDIYDQSVRKDAPWYPSNIEFIRRINGLDSIQKVQNIIFDANYLVMGLGDVYLGAPVAVPMDPRHRLVTTKYNPARTWTAENSVGIGGSYLCIYGMEGPGGYQLFGRTIQMWNKYRVTKEFPEGNPWLLRFFDQIKFFPVTSKELMDIRRDFIHGLYPLKIEETKFSWSEYSNFLSENDETIVEFKTNQQSAFNEERRRWKETGQDVLSFEEPDTEEKQKVEIPENCEALESVISGTVWKVNCHPGEKVTSEKPIMILEAMKMEVPVYPSEPGIINEIVVSEGQSVMSGQILVIIEEEKK